MGTDEHRLQRAIDSWDDSDQVVRLHTGSDVAIGKLEVAAVGHQADLGETPLEICACPNVARAADHPAFGERDRLDVSAQQVFPVHALQANLLARPVAPLDL